MAWRFKASKYKNAAPIVPKFEQHIRDLDIGAYRSHGNFIAASAAYMAFNWGTNGSNLAVLPLETKGRQHKAHVPLIHAHSEFVTDFAFSPFDDGLLATGSQDLSIKLWRLPSSGHPLPTGGITTPELTLPQQPRRVETVSFNPAADHVLATSAADAVTVWDVVVGRELFSFAGHGDEVQGVAWQQSGRLLATQSRDKRLRVIDPRAGDCIAGEAESHGGIKDSKVVWVGQNSDRILTTGFSTDRLREITIRDLRKISEPVKNLPLDMSSGILVPLFDPDTQMCFLCGKGDRNIQFVEIAASEPFVVEGLKYSGEQTKGACIVPKRAVDVMQGEVNRVLQLCDSSIVPIMWQVPRKSYRDYHADIFPDTSGLSSAMGPTDWFEDKLDSAPQKISLDPKKRPREVLTVFQEAPLAERPAKKEGAADADGGGKVPSNGHSNNGEEKTEDDDNEKCPLRNGAAAAASVADNPFLRDSPSPPVKPKPSPKPRVAASAAARMVHPPSATSNGEASRPTPVASARSPPPPPTTTTQSQSSDVKQQPGPSPKPRIIAKTETNDSDDVEMVDDEDLDNGKGGNGDFGCFRRQPSIRDRMKMLEASSRGNTNGSSSNSAPAVKRTSGASLQRTNSGDQENKENNKAATERKMIGGGEEDSVAPLRKKNIFLASDAIRDNAKEDEQPKKRPVSKMFGRVSKFKHLKGDVIIKGRMENLKNLSRTVPAESDFFHANAERVAVPLTGPGGKIAVFETRKTGRIPDGVTPVLINGCNVMDFGFDPFDGRRLAVACDDGRVRLWAVPEGGLLQQTNEPEFSFNAHADKIQLIKFHPLAKNVVLTAAFDRSVRIWNLDDVTSDPDSATPRIELEGHNDQLYAAQFSQCGRFLATVCRDGRIRIFDPRSGPSPVIEGAEIVPKKGARIVWALDGKFLIVTGFSRQSQRRVMVYRSEDLSLLNTVTLDESPAIVIPHYDADSNTLFLSGKGESTVTTFEVSSDAPHLFPLSPYRAAGLHQGFSFLHKNVCNVRDVEFARAYRITNNTIEPVSFSVPRVKTAFFQDDIFPPTRVLWDATVTADEWFGGSEKTAPRVSLRPDDMQDLSAATNKPSSAPQPKQSTTSSSAASRAPVPPMASASSSSTSSSLAQYDAKKAESDLEKHVSDIIGTSERLEQDDMEGVDDKEWENEED